MRSWFYRHPNVAVALLGAAVMFSSVAAVAHLAAHNWPRLALTTLTLAVELWWFSNWWERT